MTEANLGVQIGKGYSGIPFYFVALFERIQRQYEYK